MWERQKESFWLAYMFHEDRWSRHLLHDRKYSIRRPLRSNLGQLCKTFITKLWSVMINKSGPDYKRFTPLMCLIVYLRSLYVFWTIVLCCEKSVLRRLIRQKCHFWVVTKSYPTVWGRQKWKKVLWKSLQIIALGKSVYRLLCRQCHHVTD